MNKCISRLDQLIRIILDAIRCPASMVGYVGTAWCTLIFIFYTQPYWGANFNLISIVSADSYYEFSNKASWLPLALRVSHGDLLPISHGLNTVSHGLSFYPYISIWVLGLLIKVFGMPLALLILQVAFPVVAFTLSYKIFLKYLPKFWSLTLAALGIVSYSGLPLRDFLINFFQFGFGVPGANLLPDIAGVPFPSLNACAFLGAFYLSISFPRITSRGLVAMSCIWGLQTQVHVINGIFGIPFWLSYAFILLWRQRRNDARTLSQVISIWILQVVIVGLITIPCQIGLGIWGGNGVQFSALGGLGSFQFSFFSEYYFVAYYLLPIVLVILISWLKRIDPYEIFTKFWPVFLLQLIEFVMVIIYSEVLGASPALVNSRIAIYFLHILYYVPSLSMMMRQPPNIKMTDGIESCLMSQLVVKAFFYITRKLSFIYLSWIFLVLTIFSFKNIESYDWYTKKYVIPAAYSVNSQLQIFLKNPTPESYSVVTEDVFTNLNLYLIGKDSLIENRFSNQISPIKAITKMALFAKINGWSESKFLLFMMPNSEFEENLNQSSIAKPTYFGLGYWLLFKQEHMEKAKFLEYRKTLEEVYRAIDMVKMAQSFGLRMMLSRNIPPSKLNPVLVYGSVYGNLYKLNY